MDVVKHKGTNPKKFIFSKTRLKFGHLCKFTNKFDNHLHPINATVPGTSIWMRQFSVHIVTYVCTVANFIGVVLLCKIRNETFPFCTKEPSNTIHIFSVVIHALFLDIQVFCWVVLLWITIIHIRAQH